MAAQSGASLADPPHGGLRSGRPAEWLCAAIAIVSFANTLPNDFAYDDVAVVQNNPAVTRSGQWAAIWTTDYWAASAEGWPDRDLLYRPVTVSSFRLVRAAAGPGAWPQHLVNVLLHALAAALVVRIGRRLGMTPLASALAGAIFAVTPIHNEAVAAIVGRAELFIVIGALAALLCHHRASCGDAPRKVIAWSTGAALCSFLALGAKESGVVVAPLLVIWDAVIDRAGRRLSDRQPAGGWLSAATLGRLSYLAVPLGAYLVLRYVALDGRLLSQPRLTKTINVLADASPWQHALGAVQLFGMYWVKMFVPWVLSVGYSINAVRIAGGVWNLDVVVGAAVAVVLIVVAVRARRRRAWPVVFAIVALFLSYLPTSNALTPIRVFFAERLWYFPSVWAAVLLGHTVARVRHLAPVKVMIVAILCAAVARLWVRNGEWRDNETLYAAAVRDQPEGVQPMYLFGQWLVEHGRVEEGISLLHRAVRIDLGYADAHRALGNAYLQVGRVSDALRHLQTAQMQAPGHRPTERILAAAGDLMAERANQELSALEQAAEADPDDLAAMLALARRLREVGRVADALRRLESGSDRFGSHADWQRECAITLVMINRVDEAIERYRRAVELRSADAQSKIELAMLLLERGRQGDVAQADVLTTEAAEQAEADAAVLVARAEVLNTIGRVRDAIQTYRQAIEILPAGSEQREVYRQRLRALGG